MIVDVLSFTTAVDIAVARGAAVMPYGRRGRAASELASSKGAVLAGRRGATGAWSLSPASLESIPPGTILLLPSPNGGAVSLATGGRKTLAACLRNCGAVARKARACGARVAVIPAGEQWRGGSLRPSIEDLIGAGAVIAQLPGRLSPEAEAAVAVFERFRGRLQDAIASSVSGRELADRGFLRDIEVAAELDASTAVPRLAGDRFVNAG